MRKKKIYILLILLIFIMVLAVGGTCQTCLALWAGTVEAVGEETQKAFNSLKKKPAEEERETIWVDEEGNPINEKEETGSSQSEDAGDGSEDHHHTKNCEVIFNGTFFGTIDANGKIFANVVGSINGKDGDCKLLVKDKPESFTLSGDYHKDFNNANGEIKPQGYSWSADRV